MTNKINGIDVSEEIRYCNNCSNLGLDFKTGKFYCGLSNRNDELPEILSCDEFSTNCYIKRLQQENEELKARLRTLDDEVLTVEITLDEFERNKKYKQALENIKQFLIYADHSISGNKYLENVEKALNIANKVLNDRD